VDPTLSLTLWRLFVLAIMVLLFRRLPFVLATYKIIPVIHNFREALFTGWFGPIGVGALFYYTVAIEQFDENGPDAHARSVIKPIVYFMILASVVVHGNTVPMFYLGSFATRTLTRTSISSGTVNSVSRLPKLVFGQDIFSRRNNNEESTDLETATVTVEASQPPRQTAITIVTPKDIRGRPGIPYSASQPDVSRQSTSYNISSHPLARSHPEQNITEQNLAEQNSTKQSLTDQHSPRDTVQSRARSSTESLEDII
jgi:hypothetical protein